MIALGRIEGLFSKAVPSLGLESHNILQRNPTTDLTASYDISRGGVAIYSCLFVGCSVGESYLFLAS